MATWTPVLNLTGPTGATGSQGDRGTGFAVFATLPTLTAGAPVYLSEGTSGAVVIAQPAATDQVIRIIGYGNTTHEMFFNPSNDYITHT